MWGLLLEIKAVDWPVVQHKEGAVTGMCVERKVKVEVDGQVLEATAFTTHPQRASSDGPISPRFVEALGRGAQSAGLPAEWVKSLGSAA